MTLISGPRQSAGKEGGEGVAAIARPSWAGPRGKEKGEKRRWASGPTREAGPAGQK